MRFYNGFLGVSNITCKRYLMFFRLSLFVRTVTGRNTTAVIRFLKSTNAFGVERSIQHDEPKRVWKSRRYITHFFFCTIILSAYSNGKFAIIITVVFRSFTYDVRTTDSVSAGHDECKKQKDA